MHMIGPLHDIVIYIAYSVWHVCLLVLWIRRQWCAFISPHRISRGLHCRTAVTSDRENRSSVIGRGKQVMA